MLDETGQPTQEIIKYRRLASFITPIPNPQKYRGKNRQRGLFEDETAKDISTEGWNANTVTHVLDVRAFGTQLLCEQVIGRTLRRRSYELNEAVFVNMLEQAMGE